jgi:3-hydroxybutyryl-CoA dehydratase
MTEIDVIIWSGLTGDMNPVHIDKEYSKNTRFGRCLIPGVLVQGLISTTMTQLTFGNVYASQSIKFIKPVFVGDTVTAIAQVIEKNEENYMVKVGTKCINQNGELLITGVGMEYILP